MPADFRQTVKYCENCGKVLTLRNTRDVLRKRFCSRKCLRIIINPVQYVPPVSIETRGKMRRSRLSLLASGWKTIGWRKYSIPLFASGKYRTKGRVRLQRIIMEKHIGRALQPDECVHHLDGNKENNDIANLQLLTNSEHIKLHSQWRLQYVTTGV